MQAPKKVKASKVVKQTKRQKLAKNPTGTGRPKPFDDTKSPPLPITPEAARGGYTVVQHNELTTKPRKRSA